MLSSKLNESMMEMLDFVPLILSIGQFLIYFYFYNYNFNAIPDGWSIPIYVSLVLSILGVILPMKALNKKIFPIR